MIKGSIQEDVTIVNIYAPPHRSTPIRHIPTTIKGEIDSNTIIVRDFNTPFLSMDSSSRQKNMQTRTLNDTLDQRDLIDIYRAFHP